VYNWIIIVPCRKERDVGFNPLDLMPINFIHFYLFFERLILFISKIVIVKDLPTVYILPTFYIFRFNKFYDVCKRMRSPFTHI
jgi:hypothetical protein